MALTITNIASVLKKVIIPVIQDTLPKESILFDKIKKNSGVTIANDKIYIAARVGRHSGIYSVAEGTEPRVGKSTFGNPYASMKYTFGTLELTDQAIEAASKGDVKSIASILSVEITALKDDLRKDINRQMFGYGDGVLCLANGTGTGSDATLTVDSPGTRYLHAGVYITMDTGTARAISTKDSTTAVTIATGSAWGDNAKIRKENAIVSNVGMEAMGLQGLIDTGNYVGTIQNIVRSSNSWANSQCTAGTATLTEAQMIDIFLAACEYGKPDVVFMGPKGFSFYGSLLTSMRKTANLKEILAGGWKGLEFMDIGVVLDYDCVERSDTDWMVFFVDFDTFTIAEMSTPFQWLEADAHGGILKRSPTVRTNWEGTLKYYFNLVCKNHQANAVLDNRSG